MDNSQLILILKCIIPGSLTGIASLWIFCKYLTARKKRIDFSMIIILAISDLIFSLVVLVDALYPNALTPHSFYAIFFAAMYFSIFWATAMAYLVFSSLKDRDFDSKKYFSKTLSIILIISICFTLL